MAFVHFHTMAQEIFTGCMNAGGSEAARCPLSCATNSELSDAEMLPGGAGPKSPASTSVQSGATFSPAGHAGNLPSSPFKQNSGPSQLSYPAGQVHPDDGRPPRSAQSLQGKQSSLNRSSVGSAAGQQSLGGPSDSHAESFTSWGSFRTPEDQQTSLEVTDEAAEPHTESADSAALGDIVQAKGNKSGAESHERRDPRGDLLSISDFEIAHCSTATDDPFRDFHARSIPTAHAEEDHAAQSGKHRKRPSLSQWELQQLSGFAVSQEDASQAAAMWPKQTVEKPK
jgi:hypothetical protein